MDSSDTLTPKFYIPEWGQKVIIGGGSYNTSQGGEYGFQCNNLIVSNGGTIGGGSLCNPTGSFSNRGGLFASSSALSFDETQEDEKVAIPDATSLDLTTAATLMAWVKIPTDAGSKQRIVSKQYTAYEMGVEGGYLSVYHGTDGSGGWNNLKYSVGDLRDGKWHHLAATFDNSSTIVKLYIDGKYVTNETSAVDCTNTNNDLSIGYRSGGSGVLDYMDGDIALVSVWRSVLTGAEIRVSLFYDWDTIGTSSIDDTKCVGWYQFDEGEGTSVSDMSGSGNTGTIENASWATAGTWTAGGVLSGTSTNLYIGNRGTDATIFGSSYFTLGNRKLISGSKFASKAHLGTAEYYIATSGTGDYLNYTKLSGAPIGVTNEVKILADGSDRSYFSFDSTANNEQCHTLVNAGYVRIVNDSDFYTQDFDNSQGIWVRDSTYGGTIHDDGSTPHEYEPIDLIDDVDSFFDTEELID